MAKCEWKCLQTIALCGIVEEKVRKFANFETFSKSHSSNLTFYYRIYIQIWHSTLHSVFESCTQFWNVALGLALSFMK
jgi:hypothetical protein